MSETTHITICPGSASALEPTEWNFPMIATSPDMPERLARYLSGAILGCGGWILSRGTAGEQCTEIDFEFPRANCVEIYSVLVAAGLTLSQEAHTKLTELCQCTLYMLEQRGLDVVRLQLTVYTSAVAGESMVAADENVLAA